MVRISTTSTSFAKAPVRKLSRSRHRIRLAQEPKSIPLPRSLQHHAERTRNTCAGREFGSRITKLRRPRHVNFSPVIRSSTWYGSEAPIPKFSIGTSACPLWALWELYGSRVTRTRMILSRAPSPWNRTIFVHSQRYEIEDSRTHAKRDYGAESCLAL